MDCAYGEKWSVSTQGIAVNSLQFHFKSTYFGAFKIPNPKLIHPFKD